MWEGIGYGRVTKKCMTSKSLVTFIMHIQVILCDKYCLQESKELRDNFTNRNFLYKCKFPLQMSTFPISRASPLSAISENNSYAKKRLILG